MILFIIYFAAEAALVSLLARIIYILVAILLPCIVDLSDLIPYHIFLKTLGPQIINTPKLISNIKLYRSNIVLANTAPQGFIARK